MPEATKYPALAAIARESLLQMTPAESIGELVDERDDGDGIVTLFFTSEMVGYPGWRWTVSLSNFDDQEPSVLETELTPGDGALLAPDWVPWSDRLADYKAAQEDSEEASDDDADDESDDDDSDDDSDDDDESDDDSDDSDESDDDEDDDDDLGSDILHGGDLDGVDIDLALADADSDSEEGDDPDDDESSEDADDDESDDDDSEDPDDEGEKTY